MTTLIIFEN